MLEEGAINSPCLGNNENINSNQCEKLKIHVSVLVGYNN